jgi:hypothetical protein
LASLFKNILRHLKLLFPKLSYTFPIAVDMKPLQQYSLPIRGTGKHGKRAMSHDEAQMTDQDPDAEMMQIDSQQAQHSSSENTQSDTPTIYAEVADSGGAMNEYLKIVTKQQ